MTERCGIRLNLAGVGPQMLLIAAPGCKQWMENVTTAIPQMGAETQLGE